MTALLIATALALASSPAEPGHDHGPKLGQISFQSTCNPAAQALLEQGLGWLHSFEYAPAEQAFAGAAEADPRCAIAHWGVAMSNYHPLWAPPTAAELAKGQAAVAKARAVGGSKREQDYVAAIGAFYADSDRVDHKTRALAYTAAMEQLHRRYPADDEAAAFYALSLVAAGTMDDDPAFGREKAAAAILASMMARRPHHPGVAHYLIHGFDYPQLAKFGLEAARRYASIAPASAHAQHMPSHIFIRLGLWDEAIKSNLAADAAGRAYARSKGLPGEWDQRLHAMDYLAYSYLQTGQDHEAERILAELNAIKSVEPPAFTVGYAATAIPARLVLERRRWKEAASLELHENVRGFAPLDKFAWGKAHIHFARAVGAARSGDPALARREIAELGRIEQALVVPPGTYDWRKQVSIERQVAEAWLAFAEGKKDEALTGMRAVADLDDATEKHPVTPGAVLPAREQLGDLLLELGRPAEAMREFEAALSRAPRRLAGLYGAARAAKLAGNASAASRYYAELLDVAGKGDGARAEVREAKAHVAQHAAR
jgi:Tfp pilus assembly protein PilF